MSTVTARAEYEFASLSAEQVYDAWLMPERARQWMTAQLQAKTPDEVVTRVEIEPVTGGKFVFADSRDGSEAWGTYKRLDRPTRIAFSWFVTPEEEAEDSSLVTLEIEPRGKGCQVRVTHDMDAEWAEYVPQTAAAWGAMLAAIDTAFGSR
ncbi:MULTISPECIES: SRPBCC family protein [Devosia]|uniref:Activator of Hsp90 ATPase homologue 1/2-like C-terminal domain-containing protein n=1 Tax=Devosia equisanguinis TaxID=2490941 RepID=A0A447IDW2_9HYPH|nr:MULTISPECIES: SRPBCC family protein [Devosia]ODT49685.1 MAG: hypothetical protein ABS74_07340 [Pelagibacterium sp. SCN 63-126]ODU87697.1 MAG: hypothetical protein ABT14_04920 [Pelagibacterium sp. SCN 63-17]OJX45699.1 MAG: hypothetical protein BGO80_07910 [Devosia sp. 63-57]VDS05651.1 hypothetical protein DEVEQU_02794 [Devosia equisanguinis]